MSSILKSFQKFSTLFLAFLFLVLADRIISDSDGSSKGVINVAPLLSTEEPREIERWRAVSLMDLRARIAAFNSANALDNNPGDVNIAFLGNSVVEKGIDSAEMESVLQKRFPRARPKCYKFDMAGTKFFEGAFILNQIINSKVDVCIYGFNYLDFILYLERPDDSPVLRFFGGGSEGVESPSAKHVGSYVDNFLRNNLTLYRSKGSIKQAIFSEIGEFYLRNILWRGELDVSKVADKSLESRRLWEVWRKTGSLLTYRMYIRNLRGARYIDLYLNPSSMPKVNEAIGMNFKELSKLIDLCDREDIRLYLLYMPINPILKSYGAHDTEEFIRTRLQPFCAENNIVLYDFSEYAPPEYFEDFNHMDSTGKKAFSRSFADRLADDISRDNLMAPPRDRTRSAPAEKQEGNDNAL